MLRFATLYPPNGRVVVGRDTACDLTLTDGSVSRNHAALQVHEDGNITLEDLGSTNGTSVNGQALTGRRKVQIGDTVMVGGVTLRLERLSLKEVSHLTKVVQRLSLANKDALTGLVTRHFLDDELPGLAARYRATSVPVSVLFMDVDHFKKVNDTFGHGAGDDVLRAVARLLVMHVRDADTCVRYGGEEFVVVLPNCDERGGFSTSERLRQEIARHDWRAYQEGLAVTVSAGVAELGADEEIKAWLDRADRALYAAKRSGRDRTVSATTLTPGPRLV
jgi:diguanylate cyclase (GGDEF)-like protein